jgi:hypothetical protein
MMIDYWLAGRLGQVWLTLHKRLRLTYGEMTGECAFVAGGGQLSARRLYQVQGFAVRVWWRAGMAAFLLASPMAVALVALIPGSAGTAIGVSVALAGGCLAGIGVLEMG